MKNFRCQRLSTLLIKFFILLLSGIIFLYFSSASLPNEHHVEENRKLVFPAFTVMQFGVGLACPTQIPNRSVTTNWGVLSNLPLPSKINQLYPYVGKGRQLTHDFLYESLIAAWDWSNSNGTECILKTICQVSSTKYFKNQEFILSVLQLLFSPSSVKYPVAKTQFMIAEQIGSTPNQSCIELYPLCSHSILDLMVTGIADNERALVITSGGSMKFIVGLSVPLEIPISVNFVQNIQYQYAMIENATQLSYLNLLRSNEKLSLSRNTAYKFLTNVWNRVGSNGTACILQIICEIGKYSLSHEGILGELIDTVFTPHKTSEEKYKEARKLGKLGRNCKKSYPYCHKNILDHVTKIV